ncbi:MAG: N-acetyltransferase family protein [Halobacteriales archaeon]
MTRERRYPEETVDGFPTPPGSFTDAAGRRIDLLAHGHGPITDETEALVAMYANFDSADRAQGLPPTREPAVRQWLDNLLGDGAVNVLAWHDEFVAGHATLVPGSENAHELAIFVHHQYQGAGIGSRLIRSLLGEGERRGVERVWLSVERWNTPAVNLYRDVGFETTNAESFELEMAIRLAG